jgi:transposase
MPKPYSLDLRERVVSYVEAGYSRRAAAAHFGVSPSFRLCHGIVSASRFVE